MCIKVLYPQEVQFRRINNAEFLENLLYRQWGFEVIFKEDGLNCIAVCQKHILRVNPFQLRYCGPNIDPILDDFDYRKRSALSPIKIMTKITRGCSQARSYYGHYEQKSGTTWAEHNLEFAQMMYGDLNGSPLIRSVMQNIGVHRVRRLFQLLQRLNSRLMEYQDINIENLQMRNALRKLQELVKYMYKSVCGSIIILCHYLMLTHEKAK